MTLVLRPLTAAALAPFGTLLRADPAGRQSYPATTGAGDCPGRLDLSAVIHQPAALPGAIRRLERHPHAAQTFLPLTVGRWMVAAAPTGADGLPELGGLAAFLAGPGDAVCFDRNIWHAPMTVFDQPAAMVMMMWRAAAGDDTVLLDLSEPIPFALA